MCSCCPTDGNNDSVDARSRYLGWISQLLAVRPAVGPGGDGFRRCSSGLFWPSMIAPSPAGALPQLAGAASSAAIVDELGDRIGQADADWLAQALTRAKLPDADAARAAALLLPLFAGDDTELVGAALGPQTRRCRGRCSAGTVRCARSSAGSNPPSAGHCGMS